jgi:hypothetical protein
MQLFQEATQPDLPAASSAAIDVVPVATDVPVDVAPGAPDDTTDVVLIAAAAPVAGTTPDAAEPAAAPAAPVEASPDRSIEAAPGEVRGNAEPAAQDLPETGTGIDPRSSLGIWQLLAMVMAAASGFASWRTRVA